MSRILIGELTALLPSWVLLTCFTDLMWLFTIVLCGDMADGLA